MDIQPITITFTPTLEFLKDIAITAVEGDIGYWAQIDKYQWCTAIDGKELPFPIVELRRHDEVEDEEEAATVYTLTPEHIRKGLELALTSKGNTLDLAMIVANDSTMIDAGDADNIVQLGLFGEIVYG